jgi:hypothetical protein
MSAVQIGLNNLIELTPIACWETISIHPMQHIANDAPPLAAHFRVHAQDPVVVELFVKRTD